MIDHSNIDIRQIINDYDKTKIKVRANDLKFLCKYVKMKKGEAGFKKVIGLIKANGFDMEEYFNKSGYDWISLGVSNIFFIACVKVFEWDEDDIVLAGKESVGLNILLKIYIRYFSSVKLTFQKAAKIWGKYFSRGKIELIKTDEKQKELVFRLHDFKENRIICLYFKGLFCKIVELATGSQKVKSIETKCMFDGYPYHEFKINW